MTNENYTNLNAHPVFLLSFFLAETELLFLDPHGGLTVLDAGSLESRQIIDNITLVRSS